MDVRSRQPCDLKTADFKVIHDPAFEKIVEKLKNKELLNASDNEYLSADCVLDYYLYEEVRRQDEEVVKDYFFISNYVIKNFIFSVFR